MYLCLSQVGSSIETAERIKLVFARAASFHLSYTVLKGNLGKFKNKKLKNEGKRCAQLSLRSCPSVTRLFFTTKCDSKKTEQKQDVTKLN